MNAKILAFIKFKKFPLFYQNQKKQNFRTVSQPPVSLYFTKRKKYCTCYKSLKVKNLKSSFKFY